MIQQINPRKSAKQALTPKVLTPKVRRFFYPVDFPDPVEAIKFEMEQKGLTAKDLEPIH